jgi:hypothetical protein
VQTVREASLRAAPRPEHGCDGWRWRRGDRRLTCGHMAKPDETGGDQAPEPAEGIPPLFKIAAVLFFVLVIVLSVVFAPEIPIPD